AGRRAFLVGPDLHPGNALPVGGDRCLIEMLRLEQALLYLASSGFGSRLWGRGVRFGTLLRGHASAERAQTQHQCRNLHIKLHSGSPKSAAISVPTVFGFSLSRNLPHENRTTGIDWR